MPIDRKTAINEWTKCKQKIADIKSAYATSLAKKHGVKKINFSPAPWDKHERHELTIIFGNGEKLIITAEPDPSGPWLSDNLGPKVSAETKKYHDKIQELGKKIGY